MKNNKKVKLVGLVGLPTAIITGLILDLILERDLLEGLIFSIVFGLVFSITWMVSINWFIRRSLERKKRKLN